MSIILCRFVANKQTMEVIRVAWGDTTPKKVKWFGDDEPIDTFAPEEKMPIYYNGNFYFLIIQTWYHMDWDAKEKAVFMLLREKQAEKKECYSEYRFLKESFRDKWKREHRTKRFRFAKMFPYIQEAHMIYNTPRGQYAIQSPVRFDEAIHANEGFGLLKKLGECKRILEEMDESWYYPEFEKLYYANRIDVGEGQSQMLLEDVIKYINKQSNK